VARLEQVGGPLLTLLHEGPAALWKQLSDQAGDLVKAAFDSVKDRLRNHRAGAGAVAAAGH